jgi:4-amino-4-deoxy-L-arabinose transferase-like glycosyltransferase
VDKRATVAVKATLLLAVTSLLYVIWRSARWPLVHDPPLMHYIAWLITEGATPYRDVFDMNFPGTYLIHLAVIQVGGTGDAAWRAFDLLWLGGISAALWAYCRPVSGHLGAAAAVLLFALHHLSGGAKSAGQRDYLLSLFLLLGAYCASTETGIPRSATRWLLSGLLIGAGVTIKPHAGVFVVAVATMVGVEWWRGSESSLKPIALLVAGGAVLPALVLAWLWYLGGAGAFWQILTDYLLPVYGRRTDASTWNTLPWHTLFELICLGILGLFALRGLPGTQRRRLVTLAGIGDGLVHFTVQGKGWEYHLYPVVIFLCALAGIGVSSVLARGDRPLRQWVAVGLLGAMAAVVSVKAVRASDSKWVARKIARVEDLSRQLQALIPAGRTAQVMDVADGGIHALLRSKVKQPTRFIYDFHFFEPSSDRRIQALRSEFLKDLQSGRPAAIVLFAETFGFSAYEFLPHFPEFQRLLGDAYLQASEGDGFRIYLPRRPPERQSQQMPGSVRTPEAFT